MAESDNKRRACCILPYFGHFNDYFQLWLNSCRINRTIDWYVITNDHRDYVVPTNVKVIYSDFQTIQHRIRLSFGHNVIIDTPYDLCKYKVAYHKLFPDIVSGYGYWGFCDCDLIWGNISKGIADAMSKGYDKISWKGHFTLFKNDPVINELFLKEVPGNTTFRGCVSREPEKTHNLFDEVGINRVFDAFNKSIYKDLLFADLQVKPYNFILHHFSAEEQNAATRQIFEWNNGSLFRHYVSEGRVQSEEFFYIHFLRRRMKNDLLGAQEEKFLIVPNKFIPYQTPTLAQVLKWSKPRFYWEYYKQRLKPANICKRLIYMIGGKSHLLPDQYLHTIR